MDTAPDAVPPADGEESGVDHDAEPGGDDERPLAPPRRGPAVGEGPGDDHAGGDQQ